MNPDVPLSSDPALWERVQRSFERQGLMIHLGARLVGVQAGDRKSTRLNSSH